MKIKTTFFIQNLENLSNNIYIYPIFNVREKHHVCADKRFSLKNKYLQISAPLIVI